MHHLQFFYHSPQVYNQNCREKPSERTLAFDLYPVKKSMTTSALWVRLAVGLTIAGAQKLNSQWMDVKTAASFSTGSFTCWATSPSVRTKQNWQRHFVWENNQDMKSAKGSAWQKWTFWRSTSFTTAVSISTENNQRWPIRNKLK